MKDEDLEGKWEEFFTDSRLRHQITEVADLYPEKKSLEVNYSEIEAFDFELAEYFLNRSFKASFIAKGVIEKLTPPEKKVAIHLRVKNIPSDSKIEIRDLRSKHLGKFIAVEGLVRKATEVRPKMVDAVFQCMRCGAIIKEPQDGLTFKDPLECYKEQGGCVRTAASTKFKLLNEQSQYVDTQKIELQESPEGLRGGAQPQRLVAYAEDDLTGKISPGDRIIINGSLRSTQKRTYPVKSTLFEIFLEINSIELEEHEFEEVPISPEDEEKIIELSKDPDIYRKITASISPTIYGMTIEKEALALQLFGGVPKIMPDGTHIRGDIHIFLVGDPGTAKSQLLRYISELAPRGIYASGKSSSAAGLCVAPDTLISLSNGELVEIGTFVEDKMLSPERIKDGVWRHATNGFKMNTINGNFKLDQQSLEAVWRLKSPRYLYEVKTRTNRRIVISPNTPLPVRGNGSDIKWVKAMALRTDMYLATPRTLPEPVNQIPFTIELIDEDCIVVGASQIVKEIIENLKVKYGTIRNIASHFGINENKLYHHWVREDRRGNPTLEELLKMGKEIGVEKRDIAPHVRSLSQQHGHIITVPIKLTPDLLYFAGLIAGDGTISRTSYGGFAIRFSNSDTHLMNKYVNLCKELFGIAPSITKKDKLRPQDARFHSKIVAQILNKLGIPQSPKSNRIDVSSVIQRLPNQLLASYLRGLFDCDGSCNYRKDGGGSTVELYTSSEILAKKVQILLLRFGIISKIRKRERRGKVTKMRRNQKDHMIKSQNDIYILTIFGSSNLKTFEEHIGFIHPKKKNSLHLAQLQARDYHTNWDVIPNVGEIVKEMRGTFGLSQTDIGIKTAFENGKFNPSRAYMEKIVDNLKTIIDDKKYEGRKVVLPAQLHLELSSELKSLYSNKELSHLLGISEYRLYEFLYRKGRSNKIPFIILGRICIILAQTVNKDLAERIRRVIGFKELQEEIERAKEKLKRLQDIVSSDIFWDEITDIKIIQAPPYIYDLTVQNSHNFVANGLLAHNTAAAVKDEFGEGRWTLEAGALVLADKGVACVDELDKMSPTDRSSMHEAMEQQRISIAKAGITATLQSRCAVLGAANPKYGRFDTTQYLAQQINIPVALLSRFDLIFTITDTPDSEKDLLIAEHILRSHTIGGMQRHRKEMGEKVDEQEEEIPSYAGPYLDRDFFRKFVAYAKRIYPVMTKEASTALRDYYTSIRKQGEPEGSSVPITARQLEAFVRLSEASARVRLSDKVTEDDAQRAIRIVEYYLKKVAGEEGRFDIDIIESGTSQSQRERIRTIRTIIKNLAESGSPVEHEDIIAEAEAEGIERSKAESIIKRLHFEDGYIYEARIGSKKYRLAKVGT
ncbi:MAG: ATP-binding protein [Thermoplasmata archaeon]|nr:MAG: ATP-binding protein [Thermoplasmata archaeon]